MRQMTGRVYSSEDTRASRTVMAPLALLPLPGAAGRARRGLMDAVSGVSDAFHAKLGACLWSDESPHGTSGFFP